MAGETAACGAAIAGVAAVRPLGRTTENQGATAESGNLPTDFAPDAFAIRVYREHCEHQAALERAGVPDGDIVQQLPAPLHCLAYGAPEATIRILYKGRESFGVSDKGLGASVTIVRVLSTGALVKAQVVGSKGMQRELLLGWSVDGPAICFCI